jgi:hypothetical protein
MIRCQLLQREQVAGALGRIELIGRRLVYLNRNRDRRRIATIPGVHDNRFLMLAFPRACVSACLLLAGMRLSALIYGQGLLSISLINTLLKTILLHL